MSSNSSKDVPVVNLSESEMSETEDVDDGQMMTPEEQSQSPPEPAVPHVDIVKETGVASNAWKLCRTSKVGAGPQYNASSGRNYDRDECRNCLKKVGFPSSDGVIGIAVKGQRLLTGEPVHEMMWFCPKSTCYQSALVGVF